MATIASNKTGGYYADVNPTEAQAICDEWNEGQGYVEWYVKSWE